MVINTWDVLELPLLRAMADLEDQGVADITEDRLAKSTGLDRSRVNLGLRRLIAADYLSAVEYRDGTSGTARLTALQLLERGLRAAGAWPSA